MGKTIDQLGLGPKREAHREGEDWIVTVTPPSWSHFGCSNSVRLNSDQYNRLLMYFSTHSYRFIQDALPDVSEDDREILISGLGPLEWEKMK